MYLDFENIFDAIYKESGDINKVISSLKENGAGQMETVMLLIRKLKITLVEADSLVVNSESWIEQKGAVEKLRNDFGDFMNNAD